MFGDTAKAFQALFSKPEVTEPELQTFMEQNTDVIPTPLLLGHDLQWNCVISKFPISSNNIVDFAYITKNSGQWRFVFVELERPQKRLFVDDPHVDFYHETRQAISQVEGWKSFVERNREEVIHRFLPLMQPLDFLRNPVDFHYLLIIGRTPAGHYPTTEHSGRITRLARESQITLFTYDSILRMGPSQGVGYKKNVLSPWNATYRFKVAQADTNLFAHYTPDQIGINDEQIASFASQGYDMDAWKRGEKLIINYKMPESRHDEVFAALFKSMADEAERRNRERGTP